jgi:hypothetical protein
MNDTFNLNVGQAHHLEHAFRRTDWDAAQVHKLSEGETLRDVREVVRGYSEIKPILYEIHPQVNPKIPESMLLKGHVPGILDPVVNLYRQGEDLFLNGRKIILKEIVIDPRRWRPTFDVLLDELYGLNATVMQTLGQMPPGFIPWPQDVTLVFFTGTQFLGSSLPNSAAVEVIGCLERQPTNPFQQASWACKYYPKDSQERYWERSYSRMAVLERP